MALIENLERKNWKKFFSQMFEYTLWVLRHDRFRHVGSSVDDLRSWLVVGGVDRVRYHLVNSMRRRQFPEDRVTDVKEHFEQLAHGHRSELEALALEGIIAARDPLETDG